MTYPPVSRPPAAVVDSASQPSQPLTTGARSPRIPTDRLMGGRREIVLLHGLEEYRLRVTSTGKLLLTK